MTAATQRTPRTGPRPGASRFMPCRRGPHRSQARPSARLAGQKLASRVFAAAPVSRAPAVAAQSLGTHQESAVFYWGVTPGCVVAPNNGPGGAGSVLTPTPPNSSPLTGSVENINAGKYDILTDGTHVQIVVKVNYQGSAATPDVVAKFNQGIEAQWTGQFGDYSVRTFVSVVLDGEAFTPFVAPGNGTSNMNGNGTWFAGASGWTAAHEMGHGFGLGDQYNFSTGQAYPGYEGTFKDQFEERFDIMS